LSRDTTRVSNKMQHQYTFSRASQIGEFAVVVNRPLNVANFALPDSTDVSAMFRISLSMTTSPISLENLIWNRASAVLLYDLTSMMMIASIL
jgi:hypothetical protein